MKSQLRIVIAVIVATIVAHPAPAQNSVGLRPPNTAVTGVDDAMRQHFPNLLERNGRATVAQRIVDNSRSRAQVVGRLAELDYVARNADWSPVRSATASQNDLWHHSARIGAQVKTVASGDPATYIARMFEDHRAERFLVPDDHLDATREELRKRARTARLRAEYGRAAEFERQAARLAPLGRTYAELDSAVLSRSRSIVRVSGAVRAGPLAGVITIAVDGSIVAYQSATGQLTPDEQTVAAVETVAKGVSTGAVVGALVLAGANPVGLVVIVVGGATYLVVDHAIDRIRPLYRTTPLTASEIETFMPPGWRLIDPMKLPPRTHSRELNLIPKSFTYAKDN